MARRRRGIAAIQGLLSIVALALLWPAAAEAKTVSGTCASLTATINGTDGPDSGAAINGTSGNDVIAAYDGDDVINGGGGSDIICAGDGEDTVITTGGNDYVLGQGDDDNLSSGDGDDYIDGGLGTDVCDSGGQELDRIAGCTNPTEFLAGQSAPDLVARTAFDNKFKLSNLEGQHVLLDFSSIWCPPSDYMASYMAGVQETIRDAGVPFTYVLIELEDQNPGHVTDRRDAEFMTERYDLFDSPVLHAEDSRQSMVYQHYGDYSAEHFPWPPDNYNNQAFPTLVYINKRGKIDEVAQGAPQASDLVERYAPGAPDPPEGDRHSTQLPGVDIEAMRDQVNELAIGNKPKRELKQLLTKSLRALEFRLGPKTSPCTLLKKFRKALKNTNGIPTEDRDSLTAQALAVESLIGCG